KWFAQLTQRKQGLTEKETSAYFHPRQSPPKITKVKQVDFDESEFEEETESEFEKEELEDHLFRFFEDEGIIFCYFCYKDKMLSELCDESNVNSETLQELDIEELWEDDPEKLDKLLAGYNDLFVWTFQDLGHTNLIIHHIFIDNTPFIKQYYYRTSPKKQEFLKMKINRMLQKGLIQPTYSP
ncbi:17912_t:CDS:2, partial [Racocetra fulgida]